jgi:hypothetical protein
MRQDALVQHVGIGDHDIAIQANRLARIARRVAVEGVALSPRDSPAGSVPAVPPLDPRQGLGGNRYSALLRAHPEWFGR